MTDSVKSLCQVDGRGIEIQILFLAFFVKLFKLQIPCQLYHNLPESHTDFLAIGHAPDE